VNSSGQGRIIEGVGGVHTFHGPKITTDVTHHQKFWVVSPIGREWEVDGNYAFRNGQQCRVVWGNVAGEGSGKTLLVQNLTTNTQWQTHVNAGPFPAPIAFHGFGKYVMVFFIMFLAWEAVVGLGVLVGMATSSVSMYSRNTDALENNVLFPGLFAGIVGLVLWGVTYVVAKIICVHKNYAKAIEVVKRAVAGAPHFLP